MNQNNTLPPDPSRLSLERFPPFIGFWAKIIVIEEVIKAGFVWIAVLGVIMAVISAFYYLKVVKAMYFDKPEDTSPIETTSSGSNLAVSFFALALLVLGLVPSSLINLTYQSLTSL